MTKVNAKFDLHVREQKELVELLPVDKMPSLSAKSEPVAMTDATEFANNMISMMEKKIRNLEKRKV